MDTKALEQALDDFSCISRLPIDTVKESFNKFSEDIGKAVNNMPSLATYSYVRRDTDASKRQATLHRKAVERRKKSKRGGPR